MMLLLVAQISELKGRERRATPVPLVQIIAQHPVAIPPGTLPRVPAAVIGVGGFASASIENR
jgi:hypothetical protein